MVISAQMRLGGFYGAATRRIAALPVGPHALMGAVIGTAAALSAVFTNDVVCLAMAPVLAEACLRRRLDPVPFLLGLACASNIGSAATLIGNPQNMLIGEVLRLPFGTYAADVIVPVLLVLAVLWVLMARGLDAAPPARCTGPRRRRRVAVRRLADRQGRPGRAGAAAEPAVPFFAHDEPDRLGTAGAVHRAVVVNHALQITGATGAALAWLQTHGLDLAEPMALFGATLLLSNLVSNVPAVMLLLPAATQPGAGTTLALVSTLAGNLLIVGSIANIIVVDAARRSGITIDWRRHARTGIPVTLATLVLAALWLAWRHP